MTVAEITSEVRAIIQQTNPSNSNIADSSILGWINDCTLQLISTISTLPKVAVTGVVADDDDLTLTDNLIKMDFCSISDGAATPNYTPLTTIDFVNFTRMMPNWQNQAAAKPSYIIRMTDLTWRLWPTPSAEWLGKSLTIYGSVLPTALSSTSEEPPVSKVMHPVYPHFCAWKAFMALNNPVRAQQEYGLYDSLRRINTQSATSTTGSLLAFKIRGM